jgi:hypothetical protein
MTEDEKIAQAQLQEIAKGLRITCLALEGLHHSLPVPPEEALMPLPILETVRRHLLDEGKSAAEAALVSLDLVLAHAAAGRVERLGSLAGELESAFPMNSAVALATEKIGFSASLAEQEDLCLREVVAASAVLLLRTFRAYGLWVKPLLVA